MKNEELVSLFDTTMILRGEVQKLEAENALLREALEFYADPNSWIDESVTYVYSVIQYDDQDIPPEEHRLCDKHGGRRAREALKGEK